jgi:hypothetical protein
MAAVELLIGHGFWLGRADFIERFVDIDTSDAPGVLLASVDWAGAVAGLGSGRLACSRSQGQVLAIAASMAEGVPVDLRDALCGLDARTVALVVAAVATMTGRGPAPVSW